MHAAWTRIARHIANFRSANKGNVAITFAIATLPLVGTVGMAVDYSHANSVKAAMQAALDSTALMLSKDAATLSNTALQTKAKSYFDALFSKPEAKNVTITATYTSTGGSQIKVDGAAQVPTGFLGVIGHQNININGTATAAWGSTRLRVALALDNTGSMSSDGKMAALKSATKNLLTQLKSAATTNGDVYVSIIPFANDVNVGASNYNANWIDWKDWDDENTTTSCTGRRGRTCKTVSLNHNQWNGCVTDRGGSNGPTGQNYDQNVTLPGSSASSKFPADQDDNCPAKMMGLSYDWTAMNDLVDDMSPAGSTNQPIGLVWAWQSLVGGGPLTAPAKDANYKYTDVIILMSDGLNTENRWNGNGSSVSAEVDKRMYDSSKSGAGTCANIKNGGVTLYTIQVNTGGDPTSTLLQNCAGSPEQFSDASKFYMVTTSSGLGSVFSQIGTNLTKLRVAK
ncbi:MAG: pilus assembly protein [Pseudolabrys sp.]|nr:pilus assembly protein [Pseudolabrys sp.]